MEKKLYEIFYTDGNEKECQKLIVSSDKTVIEDVRKLMKKERNPEQNPTVLGYSWISGYYIQPISDKLEDIVQNLKVKSEKMYPELKDRISYLEALRDILSEAGKEWVDRDQEEETEMFNRITATLGGSSNVPVGYDEEGNRR
jgi:hypothetical protein